ncbi:unnamed protein product [Orchesella dallaii]|uniref:alkaline phosphatase n=1 Tax=Orchesella dallaii TaxID=48710 RepID=A0ABP1RS97_9HEXA
MNKVMSSASLVLAVLLCATPTITHAYSSDSYMHEAAYKDSLNRAVGGKPEAPGYWVNNAQETLYNILKAERKVAEAKNVIMFLGDGWGVPTITLSRILKGQAVDNVTFGEEGQLHIDTFPNIGMSKTFCADAQIADSACSSTAYLRGVKANVGTLGVTSDVRLGNCNAQNVDTNRVSSILAWAQAAGKSTGIVTTTRITHASPAGTYAHSASREWESDVDVPLMYRDKCSDIAAQLILEEPGKNINVILGGGRQKFLPVDVTDSESTNGERKDRKNLVELWKSSKNSDVNATYIETLNQLLMVDATKTDYLLGLFSPDHMAYYHDQLGDQDPSLTDMTEKAIQILSKNPKGFFLFVEGGRIDQAHHNNQALRSIWEAVEFDRAIKKGDDMTSDDDTLIVVTADHSHAFSFAGYAARGSNITQIGIRLGNDLKPYSGMSYANGPGWQPFTSGGRHNIANDPIHNVTYQQVPLVPLVSETHGGEDVMIFSKGPHSHLLAGVHFQSYIPHAMGYASCLGSGLTFCSENQGNSANINGLSISAFLALITNLIVISIFMT